jgi:hypothetical protein
MYQRGVHVMKKILVVIAVPILLGWAVEISWCNDYDWQNAQSLQEIAQAQNRESFNSQPVLVPVDRTAGVGKYGCVDDGCYEWGLVNYGHPIPRSQIPKEDQAALYTTQDLKEVCKP